MSPSRRKLYALLGMSVWIVAVACDDGSRSAGAGRTATPPARHAVHSERLRQIMQGMGTEVEKKWPQEIAEERAEAARRDRRRKFDKAAELARILSESAPLIPEAVSDVQLSETERETFLAQAETLQTQAGELRRAAEEQQLDEMEQVLQEIRTTCTACHQQFAELAGPVRFGWDN